MNSYYRLLSPLSGDETTDATGQSDVDRFSPAELQQIIAGNDVEDMLARREADRRKTAKREQLHRHADHGLLLDRFAELEESNRSLMRRVARLEHLLASAPTLENGKLPSKAEITQAWCQVFHTPNLSAKERKTKTEWSLRLTVWIDGVRVKREINVRLFSADRFYLQVTARNPLPKIADEWATALQDDQTVLAGMLTASTQGRGRPFIGSQFCVLSGHLMEEPSVELVIDADVISFETVRPSKGTSKWFLDWHA